MAIKYTREPGEPENGAKPGVRFARYSTSAPTRRALTWLIAGTALIVTLLMLASELTSAPPIEEYVWLHGVALPTEASTDGAILRVELDSEGEDPPKVFDISTARKAGLDAIAPGDRVRMQVELDRDGNVTNIVRVERAEPLAEPAGE